MTGRFYLHKAATAWFNMAFDEWLFERLQRDEKQLLHVRLYSWNAGAITLGYNQNFEKSINLNLLERNIPVIRRITGGRAIFHDPTEFTITVAAKVAILPEDLRSLSRTNELISSALVSALKSAGLVTEWRKTSDSGFVEKSEPSASACFDSTARYEVSSGGSKIAGGAQRRIGDTFIHQGSLKINGVSACPAIGQKAVGLNGEFQKKNGFDLETFAPCLQNAISAAFGIELNRAELDKFEQNEIEMIIENISKNPLSKRPQY